MGWLSDLFARKRPAIADAPAKVLVIDGECVDDAASYERVVREVAAITGGMLTFDRITCVEGDPPSEDEPDATRMMTLVRGDRTWTGRLRGRTDWIDGERLLALLNRTIDAPRRLHEVHHPSWGHEMGVVFALEGELAQLRAQGYTIEDDPVESHDREPETLTAARVIHGHAFPAGTRVEYWRDPPYDEMEVTLGAPHVVAGLALPAETSIMFTEQGPILCCVVPVAHASFSAGTRIPFADGAWKLDEAETGY